MDFCRAVVEEHKTTEDYRVAKDADLYYRHRNPTIMAAQKFIFDALGVAHIDKWSANHKIPCRFFFYFVTQAVQFLLGNGVSFGDKKDGNSTKEKFSKDFDTRIQNAATRAVICGKAYGYLSQNPAQGNEPRTYKVTAFDLLDFAPLVDEDTGALKAGVRFWQIDEKKPLRLTLYELDGYTEYIRRPGEDMQVYAKKRPYIETITAAPIGGVQEIQGENYPGFPIVPLYNINEQSDIIGSRDTLDAYDLMASALVNNVDDANLIYWVIRNAGGMDEQDASNFIRQIHTARVAMVEGEQAVDPHTINVPFEASETALKRLRSQLFDDFMALDVKEISGGAVTATQIEAAYEPLNAKTDLFEHQVSDFIRGLLALIGIDDTPTYTRSMIVNQAEMIQNLVQAAQYLPAEYITRKIMELLGDTDNVDAVLDLLAQEDLSRFDGKGGEGENPDENGENQEA